MYTRQSQILNLTIQVNSELQPVGDLPVVLMSCDKIIGPDGQQVGHLQHVQQAVIHSDLTPDMLQTLNASLAYLGYKLAPLAEE